MVLRLSLLFAAAAVVAYVATSLVKRLAERIGCVDQPGERKLHTSATPRLGGLAIIIGFALPLMLATLHPHAAFLVTKNFKYLIAVLTSGFLIVALGIYDDLFGSNAPKKFTVQAAAAACLIAFGFHFDSIWLPGAGLVRLEYGLGWVVTLVWVVGVINAVNLIDGMDTLATVVSLTIAAAFGVIATIRGDIFSLVIMTALAGSLLGFLPWNRWPAKIFMGDSGSLFIGLLLAASSIARYSKAPTAVIVGGPMLALALPVLDTLVVMKGRFQDRREQSVTNRFRRMFNADRSHIHHVLIEKYGSRRRALLVIWVVTVLFSTAAVLTILPNLKLVGYAIGAAAALLMSIVRFRRRGPSTPAVIAVPGRPGEIHN
jgi:UDP-GlcNAc:undecaprenyl-phosphate GlcNAc-1-phosphate transferase